jgi:hypothetical protein
MPILNVVDRIAGKFCRIASMLVLPQSPQLLEIVPKRCIEFEFQFHAGGKIDTTVFSPSVEIFAISSRLRTTASETKNPAASSSS